MRETFSSAKPMLALLIVCCTQFGIMEAHAEATWTPARPVTLIVPYSVGGGIDATARAAAKQLSVIWGQPVLIENLPGADGMIGARRVIASKQDGYTLLVQVPALLLSKYTPGFSGPDPVAQLEPISIISKSSNALTINGKIAATTLTEFIQHCKTSTTPCSFATGDTTGKFFLQKFVVEAGIPNAIMVNYKGGGALISDLMTNVVNMGFTGLYSTLPQQKVGAVKILVTTGKKRAPSAPEIPTAVESGLTDFISENWVSLFAPKGTPDNIVQSVAEAVREAVKDPETANALLSMSAEPIGSTPAAFTVELRDEEQRTAVMAKKYPLK